MRLSYAVTAIAAQFFCVVLVAPALLFFGEHNGLFPRWPGLVDGRWRHAYALFFLGLAVVGFLCARALKPPREFDKRLAPVLALPVLLTGLWAWLLIQSNGSYLDESLGVSQWDLLHWLTLPPRQTVWTIFSSGSGSHPTLEHIALFLGWVDAESLLYEAGDMQIWNTVDYYSSWRSLGLPMFMHVAWLIGFAVGSIRRRAEPASFRLRPRHILIPLVCAAPVAVLVGYSAWIEASLISPRPSWEPELEAKTLPAEAWIPGLSVPFEPNTPPTLRIRSNHPRMDGATAFYPLYEAAFRALYEEPPAPADADKSIRQKLHWEFERSLLACSTTRQAFSRLAAGKTDVVFAFAPSDDQVREAREKGVAFQLVPLGLDAFVFLLHEDNPVDSLTRQQIQDIYTRSVTDWSQITDGHYKTILPFQRPANSGSQTAMERLVMQGKPMTTPLREEYIVEMGGVIVRLAEYRNESESIGYSFRRYAVSREMEHLKFPAVDGVEPTPEHISDGTYPFIVPFYAVIRDEPPSPELQALLDWFTGPEGRALIAKVGYVPTPAP